MHAAAKGFLLCLAVSACSLLPHGELIDGQRVGPETSCKTRQYNTAEVQIVEQLWPAGAPPIAKICHHQAPSDQLSGRNADGTLWVNLAGITYTVVYTDAGERRVYRTVGIGFCADCGPPVDLP